MQKNKRNAIRNKIVGIMCIAALAANTAPSVIPAPYVNAFAQESTGSTVSLNSSTETVPFDEASATVIDISQLEPNDENRIVAELFDFYREVRSWQEMVPIVVVQDLVRGDRKKHFPKKLLPGIREEEH